jgi:hypothetical protein
MHRSVTRPNVIVDELAVDDLAAAVEPLRLARFRGEALVASSLRLRAPSATSEGAIVIDADNGLADVDARLSLRAIAAVLAARGWWLPLLRPWAAVPLWRLVMDAPFVVDALVQRGVFLSVDGDVVDAPRAPRHAAGPSMVHALCGPTPLALVARATLRVVPRTHAHLVVTDHGSVAAASAAFVAVTEAARAVAVDAFGTRVAVLAAEHAADAVDDGHSMPAERGALWGTLPARARASVSIAPGDRPTIGRALLAGRRVVAVPFMQRAAVLQSRPSTTPRLVDVPTAAAAFAAAVKRSALEVHPGPPLVWANTVKKERP